VAGIELGDTGPRNWVRLYPINLRYLRGGGGVGEGFRKYEVITARCRPAKGDSRVESWNPDISTVKVAGKVTGWDKREPLVEPLATDTMCGLYRAVKADPSARSLGLVRPVEITGLDLEDHTGWSDDEQRKINMYVNQFDMLDAEDKVPLEAPRLKGFYKYRCAASQCSGHRQQMLDWEFSAFQRRGRNLDVDALKASVRRRFLDEVCAPDRHVAFYVGNQAKRHQTFSILGVYWPKGS
jgi:hypothetical protein